MEVEYLDRGRAAAWVFSASAAAVLGAIVVLSIRHPGTAHAHDDAGAGGSQ